MIRRATEADIESLLDLFDEVAAERIFIGTEPGYDRERYRRGWRAAIADPARLILVADENGEIAGMLNTLAREGSPYGLELGMLVSARFRRRGLGRALLEGLFDWARSRDVPSLSLFVFPHNDAARALYRGCGFVEIQRFERDAIRQNGDAWDTILMRKEL